MTDEHLKTPTFHGELSDDKTVLSVVQLRYIRGDRVEWHMALTADEVADLKRVLEDFAPKMQRSAA